MRIKTILVILTLVMASPVLSGCSMIKKAQRADELQQEVAALKVKLAKMEQDKAKEVAKALQDKDRKLSDLEKAMRDLSQSLEKEIGDYKAKLEMTERGLVITFLAEIFFDSGKDVIRQQGQEALQKVAEVLNRDVVDSNVAIEGHTDNEPIKHSGWKSNWELSCARSLAVLHFLVDDCQIDPQRLSANGYGEYKPVASNDTPEDRQKNRRVEIVILPSQLNKVKTQ